MHGASQAETFAGEALPDPEAAAAARDAGADVSDGEEIHMTQREDIEQERVAEHIVLKRCQGTGKELTAMQVKVPYDCDAYGSKETAFIVGRTSTDGKIYDEKRAADKQFLSGQHAGFVCKASGIYIFNMGRTGTLVNERLLSENEEVLLGHGNVITFGRDCTAPGQMLPYDGMRMRVVFPEGPRYAPP